MCLGWNTGSVGASSALTVTGCPQRLPSRDGAGGWFPMGTCAWGQTGLEQGGLQVQGEG